MMNRSIGICIIKISMILSLVLVMMVSAPSVTQACSCVPPQSTAVELVRSEAVFAGEVLEVKERKSFKGYMMKSVIFEVAEAWKGVTESQIIIRTGLGGGDCGFDFQQGEDYLVYANVSTIYGDKEELVSIICSRTNKLHAAQEDLTILGQGNTLLTQVNLESELDPIVDFKNELDRMSSYMWALGIAVVSVVGFLVWRRIRR